MECHIRMSCQPFIVAFMNTVVVQNDMNLFLIAIRQFRQQLIRKGQKLFDKTLLLFGHPFLCYPDGVRNGPSSWYVITSKACRASNPLEFDTIS